MSTQTDEHAAPDDVIEGEAIEHADIEGMDEVKPDSVITIRSRSGQGVLSIDPNQEKWNNQQITALRSIGVETDPEDPDHVPFSYVWQFLHMCQKTDLDPWLREAYLITHGKRFTKTSGEVVDNRKFTLVTGIDGFRKKAEDTGQYVGQVGPQWCGEDGAWKEFWAPKWGHPTAARVGILRKGFDEPVWGVAMYDEFVPLVDEYREVETQGRNGTYMKREKTGKKSPTAMWVKMGANQIAKCAEAQGFRKTFPRTMAGMYEAAEMQRAQADYEQQQADEQDKQQRRARAIARSRQAVTDGSEKAAPAQPMATEQREPQPVGAVVDEVAAKIQRVADGEPEPETSDTPAPAGTTTAGLPVRGDGGGAGPVEPVDVMALLRRELEFQADVLGHSVERLTGRFVTAAKKPLAEFTDADLLQITSGLRPAVIARLRGMDRGVEAEAYATVGRDSVVDVDALAGDPEGDPEPEVAPEDDPRLDADPEKPHKPVMSGGLCEVCGEIDDYVLHATDGED